MLGRLAGTVAIVSAAIVPSSGCGDDGVGDGSDNEVICDASQPIRIAVLPAGFGNYMRVSTIGSTVYINVFKTDGTSGPVDLDHRPDSYYPPSIVGGQTWISDACGGSARLVGNGDLSSLTPAFYGEGADPSVACVDTGSGDTAHIYKLDLSGAERPKLVLERGACSVDATHPVVPRDGDPRALWYAPRYPDFTGAVLLAADIQRQVGHDADHNYYIGDDDALHAVDITGADEVLQPHVRFADGGATGSIVLAERTGPTRLLYATADDDAVQLFRGETGEVTRIAALQANDTTASSASAWAWGFNHARTYILHQPYGDPLPPFAVFDLDGAPVTLAADVHPASLAFSAHGVFGDRAAPQGRAWVFAPFGAADAIPLDIAWDGPELFAFTSERAFFYDPDVDRIFQVEYDGGPAVVVPDLTLPYGADDMLALHDNQLLHVARRTGAATPLRRHVGAYGPAGVSHGDKFLTTGVFYTDLSSRDSPSLWFIPTSRLPGTPW